MLPANAPVLKALSLPIVYAITHAWETGVERALAQLDDALAKGLRLVQIREGKLEPPARETFAAQVAQRVHAAGGIVLVNSDEQLAGKIGADGVHLPSAGIDGIPAAATVRVVWRLLSRCGRTGARSELGVDFAVLGPVL